MIRIRHDGVLIVGAGLAGLSAALEAARAGAAVLVVTPEPLLAYLEEKFGGIYGL